MERKIILKRWDLTICLWSGTMKKKQKKIMGIKRMGQKTRCIQNLGTKKWWDLDI